MSRRTLVYLGIAVALVVVGKLASSGGPRVAVEDEPIRSPEPPVSPPVSSTGFPSPLPSASAPLPVRRPTSSVVELGVLTDRPEADLTPLIDRRSLAALLTPALCGEPRACDAVRETLADEAATTVEVLDSSTWSLGSADVDASARGLLPSQRAGAKKLPRVVVVHVTTPTAPEELALRTATALTAAVARRIGGLVWDQLLARIESAEGFAAHAVTEPLGSGTFRRDRVEILYEPKQEGIVRVLTAGLSRWGQPDVEAATVPTAASPRVAELVLGVAQALANGATTEPLLLGRDDLARARGEPYALDAGFPAATSVEVDVVTAHPENGDPNDYIARIVPPTGEGALGTLELAERFFGRVLAAAPAGDVLDARRTKAQANLGSTLARWEAAKARGAKLLVLLPFPIPGDAGVESMWIDVTRFDGRSVTGTLTDTPLGATEVKPGDTITRPRAEVEDVELSGVGR